jgi:antitoxin MazE
MAKPAFVKTTLQRWGNSQGVRLPKSIVDSLGITVGAPVIVEIAKDQSQITITPATESRPIRGRHRIEDLIAGSSPKAFEGGTDWGKPVGKEAW